MSTAGVEGRWIARLLENGERHVLPLNDLREHVEAEKCWCGPYTDEGVLVHNSMDQRELYERGDRRVN